MYRSGTVALATVSIYAHYVEADANNHLSFGIFL